VNWPVPPQAAPSTSEAEHHPRRPAHAAERHQLPAAGDRPRPWVPEEPAPPDGWPAAPGAVPCVVTEWVLRPAPGGRAETRPVHSWLPHPAALVKDGEPGVARVRRFARAWAALAALRRSTSPSGRALCRGCVRRLLRAGVLVDVSTRAAGRTPRRPFPTEPR
jgi:hypothetical protein